MKTLEDIQDEIKSVEIMYKDPEGKTGSLDKVSYVKDKGIVFGESTFDIYGIWHLMPKITLLDGRIICMDIIKQRIESLDDL